MMRFDFPGFVTTMRELNDIFAECSKRAGPIDHPNKAALEQRLLAVEAHAVAFDLDATAAVARRLIDRLNNYGLGMPSYSEVKEKLEHLRIDVESELRTKLFMFIPAKSAGYFSQWALFGYEVQSKFAAAAGDIQEAGNCLATGRYTGTVFHLMRVMEIAVRELANHLGVRVNLRDSWGDIIRNFDDPIRRLPQSTPEERARRESLLAINAYLYAVKECWRNTTMHPAASYTEPQAEQIFQAVKTFMEHMAGII